MLYIMCTVHTRNIRICLFNILKGPNIIIVMEYMDIGTLGDILS